MTAKKTAPAKPAKAVAKGKDDDKHGKKAAPTKAAAKPAAKTTPKATAKDEPKGKHGPKAKDAKDGKKGAVPKPGDERRGSNKRIGRQARPRAKVATTVTPRSPRSSRCA